jgi:hypothetical protein
MNHPFPATWGERLALACIVFWCIVSFIVIYIFTCPNLAGGQ